MLNKYIGEFKAGNCFAINDIMKYMHNDIEYIIAKYKIPGLDKDDLRSFALEQIYDCLYERQLKRGMGIKKVLSEDDTELKNKNFIKNSIKYKILREMRKNMKNIQYTYNIAILDKDDKPYLDRNNQPLDIGINFIHKEAILYEGKKRTSVKLNIPYFKNKRTTKSFERVNPIDNAMSFEYIVHTDDEDFNISDSLEFNQSMNEYRKNESNMEIASLKENLQNSKKFSNKQKNIINILLDNCNNTYLLFKYIKKYNKHINDNMKKELANILVGA